MEGRVLEWSMGFRNHASGKYLTQETFGFALNVGGTSLKRKQTFWLQPSNDGKVCIRTHLDRYLVAFADGTFKADAESVNPDTEWTIEPQADGTWALKSRHGFYAHGAGEKLSAFTKELPADGKWVVHLAMHPQINLRNQMRSRYVHLEENELHCNEDIPWGRDALLTFVFFDEHPDGRYGLLASNGKYLSSTGRLVDASPECQFLLGFHDDQISLRDAKGLYLTCLGAKGVLKTNKDKVTKDELFVMTDSEPQFTLQDYRGKFVSNRASEEVKADQADVTDTELFQLEVDANGHGSFKNSKSKYFGIGDGGVLIASTGSKGANEKFTVEYHKNRLRLKAGNGKYLAVQSNGKISATGAGNEDNTLLNATLINRPQLVLRGQFGFVGIKGASGRLESAKPRGDIFDLECKDGAYSFRSSNGLYWGVDGDGVHTTSKNPVFYFLEFVERSKFLIRTEDGHLLEGEQNGGFKASGSGVNKNTLWEY